MTENKALGQGTKDDPWRLTTPSGSSSYTLYRDDTHNPPALICTVGKTVLLYDARCIDDLHAMLKRHGDWMELGSADEQKPAKEGTVEAWGRSPTNPIGGWYGLKKGLRGRFAMYIPRCWKSSVSLRSNTRPEAIACGPSDAGSIQVIDGPGGELPRGAARLLAYTGTAESVGGRSKRAISRASINVMMSLTIRPDSVTT